MSVSPSPILDPSFMPSPKLSLQGTPLLGLLFTTAAPSFSQMAVAYWKEARRVLEGIYS